MADNVEDIKKHIRVYITIFFALAVLTIGTVGASYLDLNPFWTIALALFIASIKASLVAGYFMHLISEQKTIYWILIITAIFFIGCLLLPTGQYKGDLKGISYPVVEPAHSNGGETNVH